MALIKLNGTGNTLKDIDRLTYIFSEDMKTVHTTHGCVPFKELRSAKQGYTHQLILNNSRDVKTLQGTHGVIIGIETYAPAFTGFYNSLYTFDEEHVLNSINYDRDEDGKEEITDNECTLDNKGYTEAVAKSYCETIEQELRYEKLIHKVKFQEIYSPREYNFETDSINCEIELTESNRTHLSNLLLGEYKEQLIDYLKERFTDRSGFYSFHSSDYYEWKKDTNGFNFDGDGDYSVKLGVVLDFIFSVGLIEDESTIYESTMESIICDEYYTVN